MSTTRSPPHSRSSPLVKRCGGGCARTLSPRAPTPAPPAALEILPAWEALRRELRASLLARADDSTARGFRLALAVCAFVFRRDPGRSTGEPLNLAGHMLK